MMVGAALFVLGLILIVFVFSAKYAEVNGRAILPHTAVASLDSLAEAVKRALRDLRRNIKKVPPTTVLVLRYFIHQGALWFARFANRLEKQAHALADRVSHKHKFQRQLPRSSYLHKVAEVKKNDDASQK